VTEESKDTPRRAAEAVRRELADRGYPSDAPSDGPKPEAEPPPASVEPNPVGPAPRVAPSDADPRRIPVAVSGRHAHLCAEKLALLFGKNHRLTPLRALSQTGQFAAEETLNLVGPRAALTARILGPVRENTVVELSKTDLARLGVEHEVLPGGAVKLKGPLVLIGPRGELRLTDQVSLADRHLHCTPADAAALGISDGQRVSLTVDGWRGARLDQVRVRVREDFRLELHLDADEANAVGLKSGDCVRLSDTAPPPARTGVPVAEKRKPFPAATISAGGREPRLLGGVPGAAPLDLVTENDVRAAARSGLGEIPVTPRAIITPAARDALAELGLTLSTRR
jgi:putative phosphotransacetylase